MTKRLFVRTEANAEVALGHLRRCLAVAEAAVDAGAEVTVMADDDARVKAMCEAAGARHRPAGRIGTAADAAATAAAAAGAACVLVDSYRLEPGYLPALRAASARVAVIDDNADRELSCDVLVNSNAAADRLAYRGDIGRRLLGAAYAPLTRPFWNGAAGVPAGDALLVTFGGVDHYGLSQRLLRLLEGWTERLRVLVAVGPYYDNADAIRDAAAASRHEVELLEKPDGLAPAIARCALGVCAGGQTLYELAAFARPSLGISLWPVQRLNVGAFAAAGASRPLYYEDGPAFDERLREAVIALLDDAALRKRLGDAGARLVDGRGASRVARALLGEDD